MSAAGSFDKAAEFVKGGPYRRVALQFPPELLSDCVALSLKLEDALQRAGYEAELHILADSAYDSASVDTVAAHHVHADCVIHYGVASLAEQPLIPTHYVFQEDGLAAGGWERLKEAISENGQRQVVVFLDHSLEQERLNIVTSLLTLQDGTTLQLARTRGLKDDSAETVTVQRSNVMPCLSGSVQAQDGMESHALCGFQWELPEGTDIQSCLYVWMGPVPSELLTHLQLHLSNSDWMTVQSSTSALQRGLLPSVEAIVKRRPYFVQKAREADIIGILVSTVSVAGILDTVNTVKRLAEVAEKHVYEIVVAKPNPAKLANFPEVGVFVMVCDPLSMILDSKEFLAACITPYEAQIAFTGKYLCPKQYRYALDQTSLSTTDHFTQPQHQLVAKSEQGLTVSTPYLARDFLKQRQFRGLVQNAPSSISPILPGRSGRASGYQDESL